MSKTQPKSPHWIQLELKADRSNTSAVIIDMRLVEAVQVTRKGRDEIEFVCFKHPGCASFPKPHPGHPGSFAADPFAQKDGKNLFKFEGVSAKLFYDKFVEYIGLDPDLVAPTAELGIIETVGAMN